MPITASGLSLRRMDYAISATETKLNSAICRRGLGRADNKQVNVSCRYRTSVMKKRFI